MEAPFKSMARPVRLPEELPSDNLGRLESLFNLSASGEISTDQAKGFLKILDSLTNAKEIKELTEKLEILIANDKAL